MKQQISKFNKKKITKDLFLVILISLFFLGLNFDRSLNLNISSYDNTFPRSAQTIQETIYINGNDPNNDWDNCEHISGLGVINNPYLLENLIIDTNGNENGILIQHVNDFLIIQNCTISHSEEISHENPLIFKGIHLFNCSNINIVNCVIIQNSHGILLSNSTDISIIGSQLDNNKKYGIFSNYSSQNFFYNNSMKLNYNTGFLLEYSHENTLLANNISENFYYGVHLKYSNNNILQNNTILENGKRNIFLEKAEQTILSGNDRKEKWVDGFIIEFSAVILVVSYVIYNHFKKEKKIGKSKEKTPEMENKEL